MTTGLRGPGGQSSRLPATLLAWCRSLGAVVVDLATVSSAPRGAGSDTVPGLGQLGSFAGMHHGLRVQGTAGRRRPAFPRSRRRRLPDPRAAVDVAAAARAALATLRCELTDELVVLSIALRWNPPDSGRLDDIALAGLRHRVAVHAGRRVAGQISWIDFVRQQCEQ